MELPRAERRRNPKPPVSLLPPDPPPSALGLAVVRCRRSPPPSGSSESLNFRSVNAPASPLLPREPDPDKTEPLAQWSATTDRTDAARVRSLARARLPLFPVLHVSTPGPHVIGTGSHASTHARHVAPPGTGPHWSVAQGS